MMRHALVYFPSEKNSRYVVDVSDVDNFKPKGRDDFDPKKLYKVRWPVLKRADSVTSNTDDHYDAFIILLAGSHQSMVEQARKRKIRLPKAYAVTVEKDRALETISLVSSSRAKKQVSTAMEKARKDRMEHIINANKGGNIFKADTGNKEPASSMCSPSKTNWVVLQIQSDQVKENNPICGEKHSQPSCSSTTVKRNLTFDDCSPETLCTNEENRSNKRINYDGQSESVPMKENLHLSTEGKIQELFNLNEKGGGEDAGSSFNTMEKEGREGPLTSRTKAAIEEGSQNEGSRSNKISLDDNEESARPFIVKDSINSVRRTQRKHRKKEAAIESSSNDGECSYIESASERRRLSDQVIELQGRLSAEYRKRRRIETELVAMQQQYNKLKEAVEHLLSTLGSANDSLRTVMQGVEESGNADTFIVSSEQVPAKNKVHSWLEQQQSKTIPGTHSEVKLKSDMRDAMSEITEKMLSNETFNFGEETSEEPKIAKEKDVVETPRRKGISPVKVKLKSPVKKSPVKRSPHKKVKSQKSKTSKTNAEEQSTYHDSKILGSTIFKALTNGVPLPVNNQGKVLLGNDVWLTQEFWKKISTSSKDLSITIQNLAEKVWGFQKCARYSLTGGKSPKSRPDSVAKEAAPPGEVEAILGFYRAKLMESGIKVGAILDQNVEKVGKGFLRSKFHNSAKKLTREMTKAEQFANKEMEDE